MIEQIENTPRRVHAKVVYYLSYDKTNDTFSCSCDGNAKYNHVCRHIKEFKKLIKEELNEKDKRD